MGERIGQIPTPMKVRRVLSGERPNPASADSFSATVEGLSVKVDSLTYLPTEDANRMEYLFPRSESGESNPAVIYAAGWPTRANDPSFKDPMGQALAEFSGVQALYVDTVAQKTTNDSLRKEAIAMVNMIEERGFTEVVISGHSEGGKKALFACLELQRRNNERIRAGKKPIEIRGMMLVQALGLYDKGGVVGLVVDFLGEKPGTDKAIKELRKLEKKYGVPRGADMAKREMKGSGAIVASALSQDLNEYGLGYAGFLLNQAGEMLSQVPEISEISVPIVLIQADKDKVSEREKIIPENVDSPALKSADAQRDAPWKEKKSLGKGVQGLREEHLKNEKFPNSPYIRVVVPKKLGRHTIVITRGEVAGGLIYLNRYWREQEAAGKKVLPGVE
jgi:hypothetical protein